VDLTQLLQRVDTFGTNFVSQGYQSLAQALTSGSVNVAALLLTLYVMFWGFGIWHGTARGGPADHAWRLFRVFIIYALATGWGDFQTLIYRFANEGPSAIGNSLLSTVSANATGTSANLNSVNGVQTALQNLWVSAGKSAEAFIKNAGVLNPGPYFIAALLLIAVACLIGYAAFLIILAKIFMWLLLALAPVFIILLLFGVTSRYFNGWMTALLQYFMVQVLTYGFVAFFISIAQTYFDTINTANASFATTLTELLPVLLISIIGILLLAQITNVAASITGSIGISAPSPGAFYRSGARLLGAGVAAGQRKLGFATRQERIAGRDRARLQITTDRYRQSAEYQTLANKISNR